MPKFEIDSDALKVVDLSYPMEPGMTMLYSLRGKFKLEFIIDGRLSPEVDETGYPPGGWYGRSVKTGPDGILEHWGTHTEATAHAFGSRGISVDQYPLTSFIGPGVVINIADKAEKNPEYKITVDEMLAWENRYGEIPDGSIIVISSGWGKYWGDFNAYFGIDEEDKHHYPGISPEACQWLVDNRQIKAIGTDTAMIDGSPSIPVPGYPTDRGAHGMARETVMSPPRNILNIEYMANVDQLPESGSLIVCAPINFVGAGAGMSRCFAFLP